MFANPTGNVQEAGVDTTAMSQGLIVSQETFEIQAKHLWYKAPQHRGFLTNDGLINTWGGDKAHGDQGYTKNTNSYILKDVSCVARPGKILAIAGPSGAGKSTLLEVLAGRLRPSSPSNSLLVNEQPMAVASFRRMSGFIPQNDTLLPRLTVRETLAYSAKLRLGICKAALAHKVSALMDELRLSHVADTCVGGGVGSVRGVSGGERRRVSIGIDVIHDPYVLFLDEPTTGLDSGAALAVVEMLRAMADGRSRTIVLSIHQPGYQILEQIDDFLLLACGRVRHFGSLADLQSELAANARLIPRGINILEYAMDMLVSYPTLPLYQSDKQYHHAALEHGHASHHRHPESSANNANGRASTYHKLRPQFPTAGNDNACSLRLKLQRLMASRKNIDVVRPCFANNPVREVAILSHRFAVNLCRTRTLFVARGLQAVGYGAVLGSLYAHAGFSESGMQKRIGFFAFTLTSLMTTTAEALSMFLEERRVLMDETSRGAYRLASYQAANLLVSMPFLAAVALAFATCTYWPIGLSHRAFGFFLLVVWMVLLMANSFCAFFTALSADFINSYSYICALVGCSFLFSGFFIAEHDMPRYWRFAHYLSLFKYPLEAMLINEYTSLPPGACFLRSPLKHSHPCLLDSRGVLDQLHLLRSSKWFDIAVLLTFIVAFQLLCYLVLRFKVYKRRS